MHPILPVRATRGANQESASAHNRRVIIDALRMNGPLSRAELARATSLTKQAVSNIVDELVRDGLLKPLPSVRHGRGQPFTPYRLVPEGAYAFGLQIDRFLVRAVVVDFLGEPVLTDEARINESDPDEGVAIIARLISDLRGKLASGDPARERRIVGLGVAMPGPFGVPPATDNIWAMAPWQAYPVKEMLAARTGLDVEIQNDAVACAIAERMVGAARRVENAICIFLGYGIAAGLIVNGDLYRGANGNAGELGMALSPRAGDETTTLEHRASLASLYQALGLDPAEAGLRAHVDALVARGDPRTRAWIVDAAAELRRSVQILEMLFDPETIILCGGAPELLARALADAMQPLLPSVSSHAARTLPRLQLGMTDPWAVARGAAASPISRAFDPRYSAMLKADTR
jgi:Transcriptional regulator/sugar kinase